MESSSSTLLFRLTFCLAFGAKEIGDVCSYAILWYLCFCMLNLKWELLSSTFLLYSSLAKLYKMVRPLAFLEIASTEPDLSVVLFVMLQGILTFESVDQILKCDHSNESY